MGIERIRRRISAPLLQQSRVVTLTNAQVLALFTTPITVVPAPKAGHYIIFDGVSVHKPAGTAYTVGTGGNIVISYTNASGLSVGELAVAGFADQATAQTRFVRPHMAASGASGMTPVAAAALVIHQLTANMTAGTSAIKLRMFFRIVPAVPS